MNTEYEVVQANKNAIAALRWVNRAIHKKNPDQQCVYVRGLTIVATNGFQIHVAIPQIDQPFPEGQWIVRSIAGDLVTLEKTNTYEPDWRTVIEAADKSTSPGVAGNVAVSTTLNPAVLANALSLSSMTGRVSMTLRGNFAVLEGWVGDEIQLRAYVMLMRTGDGQTVTIAPPVAERPGESQ